MLKLLDISKICSMIQRLNSNNLLIQNGWKSLLNNLQTRQKKVSESWKENFQKGQHFCACQKKIVEFTGSALTIYWPTNIAKKQQTVEISLSIHVCTKYLPV